MTAQDIVDDLAQAYGELSDGIWEWLHAMASKGGDGSCFGEEGVCTIPELQDLSATGAEAATRVTGGTR